MPKQPKSPQEKKRLSLQHDHRNDYGENDKSSRKNIPRSKAISHRIVRRTAKMKTAQIAEQDDARSEAVASTIATRRLQKGKWRKSPDAPLGDVIQKQLRARKQRDGRRRPAG